MLLKASEMKQKHVEIAQGFLLAFGLSEERLKKKKKQAITKANEITDKKEKKAAVKYINACYNPIINRYHTKNSFKKSNI